MVAGLAALIGCGGSAPPPPITNTAPPTAPPTAISDELVAQILTDYLRDPKTLPDAGLLKDDSGPIFIVITIENAPPVRAEHLPHGPRPFELVTLAEVTKRADATNHDMHYIHIDASFDKAGRHASVSHGVGLEIPSKTNAIKLCCCTSSRGFDRKDGKWLASEVVLMMCS